MLALQVTENKIVITIIGYHFRPVKTTKMTNN